MVSIWRAVTRFEPGKVIPWIASRNALGVALPLALGAAIGQAAGGLMAAIGALNAAYSDGVDPYPQRARRMLATSFFCALAVAAGGLFAQIPYLVIASTALTAFAAGMMVAVSQNAADIGNITLATLIVFAAHGMTAHDAALSGLLALGGGLLQTAFALALWPLKRYQPERNALAALYSELARAAEGPGLGANVAMEAPPASAESTNAQKALASLYGDRSVDAERYQVLLSQAERIRLVLLMLIRLRIRIGREPGNEAPAAILDDGFKLTSEALAGIAQSLRGREGAVSFAGFPALPRREEKQEAGSTAAMLRDAGAQLDALAGQLRAAARMTTDASAGGSAEFFRKEEAKPATLRLMSALAVLRANLSLESAAFRHAVRLAACVGLAELIVHVTGTRRGYWMPMTVAIVLKPDFTATFSRGVMRLIGTFAGLAIATAMFHVLSPSLGVQTAFIAFFVFLLRCFGPANYAIFVAALSALIVLLLAVTGVEPGPVIAARALNTCAGGAIALLAYRLWPTWEHTLTPDLLAHLLDAYRDYFRTVREAYLNPATRFEEPLDRARLTARLARSNLEASVARVATEPGSGNHLEALHSILANSHRLIHAIMSLEAGLASSTPVPARAGFRDFANAVDSTAYYLAAALRGSKIQQGELPDLRALHTALVQSGDPHVARYALVNVETDRVTNSLNTLSMEIFRYVQHRPDGPTSA